MRTADRAGKPAMSDTERSHKGVSLSPADVPVEALPVVEITETMRELADCIATARAITYAGIDGGVVYGNQCSKEAHLTGVLGELAYEQYQRPDNAEQAIYIYGDPGYDSLHHGDTVDIKTTSTHMTLPELLVPEWQDHTADKYLLAHRSSAREIRLVGYADRATVLDREPEHHPGDSLNYVVSPEELELL